MKVISQHTSAEIGMFDVAIRFKPYKGDHEEIDNEAYLNEICQWVVDSFTKHFVILEKVENIIAGGYMDNKQGWESHGSKVNRRDHSKGATYELRCCDADAFAFLLKWQC
jgi:hypothetical protein